MDQTSQNVTSFFWLLLTAFIVTLIARRIKVPYALALVVTGLVIGFSRLLPHVHLEPTLLFTVFLPPLLFESAINLRIEPLKRDWKPIAIYTLAGTILSTFLVGGLTSVTLRMSLPAALVFGALISTTDPISVIAIFKRLGAGRRLSLIIEAESLFNNDTAVVLFTVMMAAVTGGKVSTFGSIFLFLRLVVGGALLGGALGALASRIHYELDDHLIEITLTTVVAFGSYLAAEALGVSGVMAVVTAGLVIGNYGMPTAMTPGSRLAVTAFWEYAGYVVNSLVFLLIGIEVAYVHWANQIGLTCLMVVIVLIGRAGIYPLSLLVNRLKGDIPLAWQHILFWGGLRGALSMALVLGLSPTFPQREALIAGTFGVVLFSLLVQGTTVGPLLKRLGLTRSPAENPREQRRLAGEILACEAALFELERFRRIEAHPDWAVVLLIQDYTTRRNALEATLAGLDPEHPVITDLQAHEARRRALTAEKSALLDAEHNGWLESGDWLELTRRIDAELVSLTGLRKE